MSEDFAELDVRPILKGGGEPFPEIMKAVQSLQPGQGLRLLATFKPVPLFSVMEGKGYDAEAKEVGDGDWEVLFRPKKSEAAGAAPVAASAAIPENPSDPSQWPAPSREMDNRELDPPEPMVRVLAAIEDMQDGEVLTALLCRKPAFLIPELEKRGHAWHGDFIEGDSNSYKIHVRVGAGGQ